MKLNLFLLASFILITLNILHSEENGIYTGNLVSDFRASNISQSKVSMSSLVYPDNNFKSPLLSGVMSAVIPGAGQIYNGSYLKSVFFLAIEGVTIYLNYKYNKKGDDQTQLFQNFADENWSVVRYASWLNQWADKLGGMANIFINPDESLKPWKRVNWDQLNSAERTIKEFSHTLYPYGHQQYYEMIGKYPQYSQGWNDSKFAKGEYLIAGEYYFDTKGNFIKYSQMRGKANDYYNVADKALVVTITNHIISAIDAIITTNKNNSRFSAKASLEMIGIGYLIDFVPTLNLKISI